MQAPFVDPRPLYETESPLSTRVGAFGRYLVVDSKSQSLFREVTQRIARHSPIIDIGCGVGVPLLPVGPTVLDRQDVIAGDLSLRQLRSISGDACGPPPNLLQFDATRLPFRSPSFGSAVARHMRYQVADPRLAAAGAARVIRDDGLFVATTNSSDSRLELQNALRRAVADPRLAAAGAARVIRDDGLFVATTNSSGSRLELQNALRRAVADLGGRLVDRMSINFDAESGGRKLTGSFREVQAEPWVGVLSFPAVDAVLDYYRSTAYFKMAFDAEADRARLAGRVLDVLRSRFGDGPAPLTVGGAIFLCTGPIRGRAQRPSQGQSQ